MRKLVLTGMATEHDFSKGGEEQYYLLFNGGESRIPVPQETAEAVIRELFGVVDESETTAVPKPVGFSQEEIEEQRQLRHEEENGPIVMAKVGSTFDDDGVDQV